MAFSKPRTLLLLASAIILTAGCSSEVVERDSTLVHLKVTPVKGAADRELRIKGSVLTSLNLTSTLKEKKRGEGLNILVVQRWSVFSHGPIPPSGGAFDYTLKIPDDVNEVTFGKKQAIIWKRGDVSPTER